jgi:phosphate acetyltransferase
MELLERIKLNAKKHNMRIVLPEGYEERNLRAADIALSRACTDFSYRRS